MVQRRGFARSRASPPSRSMGKGRRRLVDIGTYSDAHYRRFKSAQLRVCGGPCRHLACYAQEGQKSREHWHALIHSVTMRSGERTCNKKKGERDGSLFGTLGRYPPAWPNV